MATFTFLEQSQEDDLHRTRLLNVEEKPFKRITKRLLTPGSLINTQGNFPPTPPPESADAASEKEAAAQQANEKRRIFRDDVLLDFANFDSSIERIQFLRNSNARERERYAADKIKIVKTAQEVRDSTSQLRIQLEEAKATLDQRKKFDELAEKITSNRLLRPRDEQHMSLRKLEEECRELETEKETYAVTWRERGEQFERIVQEGEQMRRLIRDEKEEVERREGMEDFDEDGEVGDAGSKGEQTPMHRSNSGAATPRVEGENTPRPGSPDSSQAAANGDERESSNGLKPLPDASRPSSRISSRRASPARSSRRDEEEDAAMDETKVAEVEGGADTPMADFQNGPSTDFVKEREEDSMDTT